MFTCNQGIINGGSQAQIIASQTWEGLPTATKCFPHTKAGLIHFKRESKILFSLQGKSNYVAQAISCSPLDLTITLRRYEKDLFQYVFEENVQQTEQEMKHMIMEICKGVKSLHKNGIAHLDIKPENILVDTRTKRYCFCDFGFSFITSPKSRGNVQYSGKFGTAEYKAPEIEENESFDPFAADIYSLGCTIYALSTGCFPDSACPSEFPTDCSISASAKSFISSMLCKQPQNRPSIDQLLNHPFLKDGKNILTRIVIKAKQQAHKKMM